MPQKFPVDSIVPSVRPLLLLVESDNGQLHHVKEAPSDAYKGQLPCCGGPSIQKIRFNTHEQGGQGGGTDDKQVQGGTCSNSYNYSQTPVTTSGSLPPSKPCCTNRRSSLTTGWLLLTAFRLLLQSFRLLHISCPIVEWLNSIHVIPSCGNKV